MKKYAKFSFFILVGILTYLLLSIPSIGALDSKKDDSIRIGVANLNFENNQSNAATKELLKLDCDILVLLEWTSKNLNINQLISSGYNTLLNQPTKGTHGICILTKNLKNTKAKLLQSPVKGPCRIPFGMLRFTLNNKNITFFGIHAPPPINACKNTTEPTLNHLSSLVKEGLLIKDFSIGRKDDLVVIGGDMNTIPIQKSITNFENSGLTDCVNWSFAPTWSPLSWTPSIFRIDYIFASKYFKNLNNWNKTIPGSDHRIVITDLKIIDI